jgi:hypothetical protein
MLIYYNAHRSEDDALRREAYFKTTKGKVTLRQMGREWLARLKRGGFRRCDPSTYSSAWFWRKCCKVF